MNEQLQSKLVEILTSIQEAAKAGGDFALQQLPDIAQQYVAYGRLSAVFFSVFWLAAFGGASFVALRYGFLNKAAVYAEGYLKGQWLESRVFVAVFGTLASLLCMAIALANLSDALLVWLAPKVWLLKELASLIK